MLKLKANPTFKAPVKVPTPEGHVTIQVIFKHMAKDAYKAFVDAEKENKRKDEAVILDIAAGWEGVDAEFGAESVRELCQMYHGAASAFVTTWIEQLTQYRVGN